MMVLILKDKLMVEKYKVKPFNKFSLGGCFEEAYISAIRSLGVSDINYILNFDGRFGENEKGFFLSTTKKVSQNEFEKTNGIYSEQYLPKPEDVVRDTVSWLEKGFLVIVRVKGLMAINIESGRRTQRSFSEHWILVYGFDIKKKQFAVLEHLTNLSARYLPCETSFEEYKNAYTKGNKEKLDWGMYVLGASQTTLKETCPKSEYIHYIVSQKDALLLENKALLNFLDSINIEQMTITLLNEIIKKFQRDKWIEETIGLKNIHSDSWIKELYLIRTYCIKAMSVYKKQTVEKLDEHKLKAMEICDLYYQSRLELVREFE